ncbi:MAG: leucine-rich repeat protein, partial [Lentisphaeria bacterium]|nr:leucine-rich repeat protein [Lentisphaeria bacterium]
MQNSISWMMKKKPCSMKRASTIGLRAFYNCSALESVTLSDTLTTIENSAFRACSALTEVLIPSTVTSL